MHPVLVRVLPASVRRNYYEFIDGHLWRDIKHRVKMATSPSYRAERKRLTKMIQSLSSALEAGYKAPVNDQGTSLKIESLESTMKVVTFSDYHIKTWKEELP